MNLSLFVLLLLMFSPIFFIRCPISFLNRNCQLGFFYVFCFSKQSSDFMPLDNLFFCSPFHPLVALTLGSLHVGNVTQVCLPRFQFICGETFMPLSLLLLNFIFIFSVHGMIPSSKWKVSEQNLFVFFAISISILSFLSMVAPQSRTDLQGAILKIYKQMFN